MRSFVVGNLFGFELDNVAGHVANCERCDADLQQLDDYADGLISDLQTVASERSVEKTSVPRRLLAVVRSDATTES